MSKRFSKPSSTSLPSQRDGQPTLKDVGRLAGVSVGIASRVLACHPGVRVADDTRQRILNAARQLEYRPNAAARSLKVRQTRNLLLLVPDLDNPVYGEIIRGAEKAADQRGYILFTGHLTPETIQCKKYLTIWQEGRVDGLLLGTASVEDQVVKELERHRVPFVLLNRRANHNNSYVVVDDAAGSQMAVEYLLSLGHRRVAYLADPLASDVGQRRLRGYQMALAEAKIKYDPSLCEKTDKSSWENGEEAMSRLLRRGRFTALLAGNLVLAVGAMTAIRAYGLRIPEDISVMGINDASLAAFLTPPLSVVRMPLEAMGFQGVQSLADKLGEGLTSIQIMLPPLGLALRGSTGPPLTLT